MVFAKEDTFSCQNCNNILIVKSNNIGKKICPNCSSVYIKSFQGIAFTGEKSFMTEDMTLLCIYAKGKYDGFTFEIIGRKRIRFDDGYYRNDWYLLFENGTKMWLYESFCKYTLASDEFHVLKYYQVKDISANEEMYLTDKQTYTVETITKFESCQMEGELPELKQSSSQYRLVELSDKEGSIAFIDLYSKEDICYSLGKRIDFNDFNFSEYRQADGWIRK